MASRFTKPWRPKLEPLEPQQNEMDLFFFSFPFPIAQRGVNYSQQLFFFKSNLVRTSEKMHSLRIKVASQSTC